MFLKQDLFIAIICSFVVFWLAFYVADGEPALNNPDGATAIHVAKNLASGDGLVHRRIVENEPVKEKPLVTKPPFFSVLIAGLKILRLDAQEAAGGLVLVCYSLAVGVLYLLARSFLPKAISIVVAVLFAIQGSSLRWGTIIHEEMVLVLLIFITLLFLIFLLEKVNSMNKVLNWQWMVLGILVGVTQLTSYQGFVLMVVVTCFVVSHCYFKLKSFHSFVYYIGGVVGVGLYPFLRFVVLYQQGIRSSFKPGAEASWLLVSSNILHGLQETFSGSLYIWMYKPDIIHYILIIGSFLLLLTIFFIVAISLRYFSPISIYVAIYFITLWSIAVSTGSDIYESRFLLPVNGLIILIIASFFYILIKKRNSLLTTIATMSLLTCCMLYVAGQYNVVKNLLLNDRLFGESGDYCHSPRTIEWVKQSIAPGSIVVSPQCGYQLLADVNYLYWLPIPPADEYATSPRFNKRWEESDFIRLNKSMGARWIVILHGHKGDPFQDNPGYGDYVQKLFKGEINNKYIRKVAKLSDGYVYNIVPSENL